MKYRVLSLLVLVAALGLLLGTLPAVGGEKNTHVGKFVSAKGNEFTMESKGGKEHSHTLAPDAKVLGPDGAATKLDSFQKGQLIRVTTKEGDMKIATKVEAIKRK